MLHLKTITAAGIAYALMHDTDDDSRPVVRLSDMSDKVLLRFDSSCNVLDAEGKNIGRIQSQAGRYVLHHSGNVHDLCAGSWETSWRDLEKAEAEAARIILTLSQA